MSGVRKFFKLISAPAPNQVLEAHSTIRKYEEAILSRAKDTFAMAEELVGNNLESCGFSADQLSYIRLRLYYNAMVLTWFEIIKWPHVDAQYERFVIANYFFAARIPEDPGIESIGRQLKVFSAYINDAADSAQVALNLSIAVVKDDFDELPEEMKVHLFTFLRKAAQHLVQEEVIQWHQRLYRQYLHEAMSISYHADHFFDVMDSILKDRRQNCIIKI